MMVNDELLQRLTNGKANLNKPLVIHRSSETSVPLDYHSPPDEVADWLRGKGFSEPWVTSDPRHRAVHAHTLFDKINKGHACYGFNQVCPSYILHEQLIVIFNEDFFFKQVCRWHSAPICHGVGLHNFFKATDSIFLCMPCDSGLVLQLGYFWKCTWQVETLHEVWHLTDWLTH